MSRLQLRASQRRRLEHVLRTARDAGLFRRVLAILEVDSGRSIAETARLLRTSRVTVYHWIGRFQRTRDPTSLVDHRRGNRPSVWDEELQDVLRASRGHRPEPFGDQAVEWTVPLLGEHLALWCGFRPSASSIRRQLHALGYVCKRPRYVLDPDPKREKKKQIRREIRQLPARCVKLFEDETDLLLFPPLRAAWGLRGQPTEVPISGFNARRVVFGTINIDTGHRLFLARQRQRGEDFRAFLAIIHSHYRGWQVALLLDEDPSHTAHGSKDLAAELGIRLIWLPKRCPELNRMDHLWGHGKDHILANRQFSGIDEEVERFIDYLSGLSHGEALKQAGILSENFWLGM